MMWILDDMLNFDGMKWLYLVYILFENIIFDCRYWEFDVILNFVC